jgi:AcrR family transcriptional regulator
MTKELSSRSQAKQSRSKEKKSKLLQVTKELIGLKGSADVSMREIAQKAGIPIASVYHYYPNKDAIIAEIMENVFTQSHETMQVLFSSIMARTDLKHIINQAVDGYFKTFEDDPDLAIIWANIQASPVLNKIDMDDTRKNAKMIADILTRKFPGFDYHETIVACFSLLNYATHISRMVIHLDKKETEELKKELKKTVELRVQNLLDN